MNEKPAADPFDSSLRLRFPRRFRLVSTDKREFNLVSMYESMRVRGADGIEDLLDIVLPSLEEGATFEQLLAIVGPSNHRAVQVMIQELEHRGMIVGEEHGGDLHPHEESLYRDQERFFSNFRPLDESPTLLSARKVADNSVTIQRRLKESNVLLLGLGRLGSRVAKGLAHAGIGQICVSDPSLVGDSDSIDSAYRASDVGRLREDALVEVVREANSLVTCKTIDSTEMFESSGAGFIEPVSLVVLCDDGFDPERHRAVNQICLERGVRWISCRNLGFRVEVGPLVVPRETACFKCFQLRKASNTESYDDFIKLRESLAARGAGLGALNIVLGYEVLALEILKSLSGFSPPSTYANVWSFDPVTLASQLHPVLKLPRCPACGAASRNRPSMAIWDPAELLPRS
jgi:molybdopterin-synthase adenylyltransferase